MEFTATPQKAYSKEKDKKAYKKLLAQYGKHKVLPKGYELQALRALSHYPELLESRIVFRFQDQPIAHSSRPSVSSLFRLFRKRTYYITISVHLPKELHKTLFQNLNYNAQIGVLCHELAHTAEYVRKSNWWIIALGMKYGGGLFKSYKYAFENNTDMRAIDHGAGYQLLEWSKAVHATHIKDGRGKYYYSPEQIKQILKNHVLY